MYYELQRAWKTAVVDCFKVPSKNLPRGCIKYRPKGRDLSPETFEHESGMPTSTTQISTIAFFFRILSLQGEP
jgi:hypothetical protein